MAIYEFEGPDGRIYEFDGPDQVPSQPTRTQRVEGEIAQAPSAIGQVRSMIEGTAPPTQQPFADSLHRLMTGVQAGREAVFGVPADILLARQQGRPAGNLMQELGNVYLHGGQPTQQPGTIASDLRETLAGRRPAGLGHSALQAGIENPIARAAINNPDVTTALVKSAPTMARAGTQMVKSGFSGARNMAGEVSNFLRGNPSGIEQAERGVAESAGNTIRSYRKGGTFHGAVRASLQQASEEAWAPAEAAAKSLGGELISANELRDMAINKFQDPDDTLRLKNILDSIDEIVRQRGRSDFSASELMEASSKAGQAIRRGTVQGTQAMNVGDLYQTDVRSILLDAIERKVPEEFRGGISKAFSNYRRYATVRNQLYKTVRPMAGQEEVIGSGAGTIQRALGIGEGGQAGKLDAETIVNNLRDMFGIDLTGPVKPAVGKLQRAKTIGTAGKVTTGLGGIYGLSRATGLLKSVQE